jgi:sec-independent protein translocase protein TatB
MLDIGWGDFLVLVLAGLFILGPERLPGAASWLGRTVKQVREYATGAQEQMRSELGDFEELRKPLQELREPLQQLRGLRNLDPKRAVNDYFRDTPATVAPAVSGQAGHRPLDSGEDAPYDQDAT